MDNGSSTVSSPLRIPLANSGGDGEVRSSLEGSGSRIDNPQIQFGYSLPMPSSITSDQIRRLMKSTPEENRRALFAMPQILTTERPDDSEEDKKKRFFTLLENLVEKRKQQDKPPFEDKDYLKVMDSGCFVVEAEYQRKLEDRSVKHIQVAAPALKALGFKTDPLAEKNKVYREHLKVTFPELVPPGVSATKDEIQAFAENLTNLIQSSQEENAERGYIREHLRSWIAQLKEAQIPMAMGVILPIIEASKGKELYYWVSFLRRLIDPDKDHCIPFAYAGDFFSYAYELLNSQLIKSKDVDALREKALKNTYKFPLPEQLNTCRGRASLFYLKALRLKEKGYSPLESINKATQCTPGKAFESALVYLFQSNLSPKPLQSIKNIEASPKSEPIFKAEVRNVFFYINELTMFEARWHIQKIEEIIQDKPALFDIALTKAEEVLRDIKDTNQAILLVVQFFIRSAAKSHELFLQAREKKEKPLDGHKPFFIRLGNVLENWMPARGRKGVPYELATEVMLVSTVRSFMNKKASIFSKEPSSATEFYVRGLLGDDVKKNMDEAEVKPQAGTALRDYLENELNLEGIDEWEII